jgi:hypothetical protein
MKMAITVIAASLSFYSHLGHAVTCDEVRLQYQNYLSCLPKLQEDMKRLTPSEFRINNRIINRQQAKKLAREITTNLLGIVQFHKSPGQIINFESRRWVNKTFKDFLGGTYKELPVMNRAEDLIAMGDTHKHGVEIQFEEATYDDEFHYLEICQFHPDEYLDSIKSDFGLPYKKYSYCTAVKWQKKDLGIYHPIYKEFNSFFSYDSFFGVAEDAFGFQCDSYTLKGHPGFASHNYASAVSDYDLTPKTFNEFVTGISALRLDNRDDYKFARGCGSK